LKSFVVDTNVIVVSNGKSDQAGPVCVLACVDVLEQIKNQGMIVLDDRSRILNEYKSNLSFSGQPGLGDAFFKWIWQNQANPTVCERVEIHSRGSDYEAENYYEFPDDPSLLKFDSSDRKFVAVALASKNKPEVLNAVDSDWWEFQSPLENYGIRIRFLCKGQFEDKKK
jgi:hypothetical protein